MGVTVRELIALLCEILGRRIEEVTITEAEGTVGDPRYSVADITALVSLGIRPRVGLRQGLERLIQARRQQAVTSAQTWKSGSLG